MSNDTCKGDSFSATNPKDIVGTRKAPVGLVPDTIVLGAVEAFLEGALKYGRYNWRIAGVSASIYHDALDRHLKKWWNGQNADKATKVHHLKSVIACAGILLDAIQCDKLVDDRPPCEDPDTFADYIDSIADRVAELKELFKDHSPYQYTIADTPREPTCGCSAIATCYEHTIPHPRSLTEIMSPIINKGEPGPHPLGEVLLALDSAAGTSSAYPHGFGTPHCEEYLPNVCGCRNVTYCGDPNCR